MNEATPTTLSTTQVRVYEDDTARLDAVVESMRRDQPRAARPDAIRRLLDAYEAGNGRE